MKYSWIYTVVALLLVAAGSYGAYRYLQPQPLPSEVLYGNGHIEGTPVHIRSELTARVIRSYLEEGTTVAEGDTLVRLDDQLLQTALAKAKAEIRALKESRDVVRQQLETWRHHRETAEKDLARQRSLLERELASPRVVDQAENRLEEARGQIDSREARLREIAARVEVAREEVERIRIQLRKTVVRAPREGTVLEKHVESGEIVSAGSLVAVLVNLRRLEMKVYVTERQLGKVRLGAPVRVRVDAFPDRVFSGRVNRVDQRAQFTPRDIHLPEERERLVFGITLGLENPDGVLKPGMPADVWILWKPEADWPQQLVVPRE